MVGGWNGFQRTEGVRNSCTIDQNMFAPTRLAYALRPHASIGIIAAAMAVAIMFSATPFAVPAVSERLDVPLGTAGLISSFQVGAFALTAFIAGRRLTPTRSTIVAAAAVAVAANGATVFTDWFPMMLATRSLAGMAAGLLTWISWADAMSDPRSMKTVSAIGPASALIAVPVFAWVASTYDDRIVWLIIAAAALPSVFVQASTRAPMRPATQRSPSRSNRVLLLALFTLTLTSSAFFIYAATAGVEVIGMSPVVTALGYSMSAATSFIATRFTVPRGTGGYWLILGAATTAAMIFIPNPLVYFAAMALWGFTFWLGVPDTLALLVERSLSPAERSGDAQSVMAVGRSIGPFAGGLLVGDGNFGALAVAATVGVAAAGSTIAGVTTYRRTHPVDYGPDEPPDPPPGEPTGTDHDTLPARRAPSRVRDDDEPHVADNG